MVQRANIGRIYRSNASRRRTEQRLRQLAQEKADIEARRRLGPKERAGEVLTERLSYALRHPTRFGTVELGAETAMALLASLREAVDDSSAGT